MLRRSVFLLMFLAVMNINLIQAATIHYGAPNQSTPGNERQTPTKLLTRYMIKIRNLQHNLKMRIPDYPLGSLAGARAADTRWAKTIIQNQEAMTQIYAENRSASSRGRDLQVAFHINDGEIIFISGDTSLAEYKSDPAQPSVIQLTATSHGPRIQAATKLTAQGMKIQATVGCNGCHSS